MGKVFGVLMLVTALWAVAEISTKGTEGAFGGVFATPAESPTKHTASIPKRAGTAVDDAHHEAAQRRTKMLGN